MARTSLITNADLVSVKRLRSCEARTPAGMMRAANKILDDDRQEPIASKKERGARYIDQRCETIDPNWRSAPISRMRSPRQAKKRRSEGWVNCNFALPKVTLQGLRAVAIELAQEQRRSEWPGEAAKYPKSLNYYVCASLNDFFEKMGHPEFTVSEQQPIAGRVRRFMAPTI